MTVSYNCKLLVRLKSLKISSGPVYSGIIMSFAACSLCSYWIIWWPQQHRVRHPGSEDAGAGASQPAGHLPHLDVCVRWEQPQKRWPPPSLYLSPFWSQPLHPSSTAPEPCEPSPLPPAGSAVLRCKPDLRQRQPLQHQPLLSTPWLARALFKLLSLVILPIASEATHSVAGC